MMILLNAAAIPDPQEMSVHCLSKSGGGIARELRAAWIDLPLGQAAAILGPCAGSVNITFTDPVTGLRQTLPMLLADAQARVAREDGAGSVYGRLSLTLREA